MTRRIAVLAALCTLIAAPSPGRATQPATGQPLEILGLLTEVPASWQREPPASAMRLAQFRLPGEPHAMLVVYFFGAGQGGSVGQNIARWSSQFSAPGGIPVTPRVRVLSDASPRVTLVDLEGTYRRGVGSASAAQALPGQALLAAIVEAPKGTAFVQLWGASATVRMHQAAFEASLHGLAPSRAR